jgi:hypothetical protein
MSISRTDQFSQREETRGSDHCSLIKQRTALEVQHPEASNGMISGHMGTGLPRVDDFSGIKPMRRWRRPGELFASQGGQNEDKRGESKYLFKSFDKEGDDEKSRNFNALIIRSLIQLINAVR